MTIKEFKLFFSEALSEKYPKTEIDSFFFILMEEKLQLQRIDTVLQPNFLIVDDILSELKNSTKRLQKEEPIQYILGKTEFYGLPFLVDKNTLIPRPETEELVAWVLQSIQDLKFKNQDSDTTNNNVKPLSILDIGTGTGCIPISFAKHQPNATISAIDVSNEALKIAKQNAILNNVEVNFIKKDILQTENLNELFDVIVSNPPYITGAEMRDLSPEVLNFEPHIALTPDMTPDNDGLDSYRIIARDAPGFMTDGAWLIVEIGPLQAPDVCGFFREAGLVDVSIRHDLDGRDRVVVGRKPA